jgi:hypothetical protein
MLSKGNLLLLKLRAKRSGVWFKALNRIDRALIDLTMTVADKVRSIRLAKALSIIISKVENALKNKISRAIYEVGFPLAHKFSLYAKKWGNPSAENWISDMSFASFLAIMHINSDESMLDGSSLSEER